MTRSNALGKGLGALLPGAGAEAPRFDSAPQEPEAEGPLGDLVQLSIDEIDPNPDQPRRRFDAEQLQQLSDSIRLHGVLQPVVVRRAGDRYELLVGERRWRASRAAGLTHVPAVLADVAPRERLEVALVENVQRRDLNPIELAHAFAALTQGGATQEEIGKRVGLDRSTIANQLRLLELPREYQEDVESGRISGGHAKALLQVGSPERRRQLRDRIMGEGLSVRAAESLAQTLTPERPKRPPRTRPSADPNLQRVVDSLRQRLQTRVRIQGDAARGRIEIEYFGDDDLQRLVELLLGDG
jgi:ParB family chromosome partitioning protein